MKRMQMLAVVMMGLLAAFLGGCSALPAPPAIADQQAAGHKLIDAVTAANQAVEAMRTEVAAVKAAATQPLPATTQNAPPVFLPAPVQASIVKAADQVDAPLAKAQVVGKEVAAGLQAAVTPDGSVNPSGLLQAIIPFVPPPYQGYAALAGIAGGIAWGLLQKRKATQANNALVSATDGLAMAIAGGHITISPAAPAVVNALVTDHPGTDALVDTLSDGAKTPRIA